MTAPRHALMVLALAAAMTATPVLAQRSPASVDAAKASAIRRLLDLTGAARLALSGMEAMVPAQRAANPQESMGAGQRWGTVIGREVGESLARSRVKPQTPN